MMAELLAHGNDRVVRAMSGALRNLAIDNRNCELLGKDVRSWRCIIIPGRTLLLDLFSSCRFACSASPCGQLAWRPESVGTHSVRGDRRVCTEHACRGSRQQPGGGEDPPSLAGHREAGAYQQGRVSLQQELLWTQHCCSYIRVCYASEEGMTLAGYCTNNPDSVCVVFTASAQIVRCGGRARCCSSSGPTKNCVDL